MLPAELAQKYEVRGTLGAGAMGTVLDAVDRIIERRVAIKVVKVPSPNDPDGAEAHARFRREAQAAGRLSHPNIVGVYDYGENSETAWIVMELVEGGSLKDRLDKHERFTVADVARLMGQVCSALAYSHARGVVHRDIKPGNIMMSSNGADAQVKIADFGIARLENSSMTQVGTLIGTPSYMAPEQFRGEPVDARADIWAAGVMLYQLLTGEKPFEGGFSAVMHKALHTEPPPPSQLSGIVPRSFDEVIRRALAKRPEDRYSSAEAFAAGIQDAIVNPGASAAALPMPGGDADATMLATGSRPAGGIPGLPGLDGAGAGPAMANTAATGRATASAKPVPPPSTGKKSSLPLILGGAGGLVAAAVAAWFFVLQPDPGPSPQEIARQAELVRQAEQARQEAQRQAEAQATAARGEAARQETARLDAERNAEATRLAEAARRDAARAEAERQAEAQRQEAARQTELARLAETQRLQRLTQQEQARQQALLREQEAARQAEASRQAEAARQAEGARQSELARQAEVARQAEALRQSELARLQQQAAAAQQEAARQAEIARLQQGTLAQQQEAARQAELARLAEAQRQADLLRQQQDLAAQQEAARQAELARQQQLALVRPDFRAAAIAGVQASNCGLLSWTASDESLTISGAIRRGDDVLIRQELSARNIPEGNARLALQLFEGPYCAALDLFRPVLVQGDQAPRVTLVGTPPLVKGQLMRLDVQMPDFPAHLYVAYFMKSGEVAHLVPSQLQLSGARIRLGEPRANFAGWEVDEPFGTDLAIIIASDRPLFATTRPVVERQEDYLNALSGALRNARTARNRVLVRPIVIETVSSR